MPARCRSRPGERPRSADPGTGKAVRRPDRPAVTLIRPAYPTAATLAVGTPELDVYTLRIYSPKTFEWDPEKREANLRKHGIDFADAVRIFEGPVLEREDRRRDYSELRFVALGAVEEVLLSVVYTPREPAFRIISAREANRHEKAAYRQVQSPEA